MKNGKRKYDKDMPKRMYTFFASYSDATGAPSFGKFARTCGICVEDIESFRANKRFDRAYRECLEIRRDYLIDRALTKRFDPTFVKFLIGEESSTAEGGESFLVTVEVEEE